MKSKRRKRVIASVLCMVLMLSTGMSTLAEADAGTVPAVEETTAAQTTAQETKSTSTDAQTAETETQTQTETETQTETKQTEEAAQTKQEETTAAQPTEEASSGETTPTETEPTTQNTQDQTTSAETSGTEAQNEAVETQPKETETTTPTEETQETKEEASVSPAFNETYENSEVTVKVTADEGIVPEGAELSVTPIVKKEITDQMSEEEKAEAKKINDQYDLTEKKLSEDSDKNKEIMEGFLAYDISFLVDGKEVEPSGDAKVVIDFKKAAVPEGVSEDADVAVKHLKEDPTAEDGVVVENMDEKATVKTTEKAAAKKIELVSNSFSTFTITWVAPYAGTFNIVAHYVYIDEQGDIREIPNDVHKPSNSEGIELENNSEYDLKEYADQIDGYTYREARVDDEKGKAIKKIQTSSERSGYTTYYYLKYLEEAEQTEFTDWLYYKRTFDRDTSGDIYFVYNYTPSELSINNNIIEEGTLDAVYAGEQKVTSYQWYKSDSRDGEFALVERVNYQNGASNLSDNGDALYPAYDEGARKWYYVEATLEDGTKIQSAPFQVPYYDELQNGSFENPEYRKNNTYTGGRTPVTMTQVSNEKYKEEGIWQTTGTNRGKDIEILGAGEIIDRDGTDGLSEYYAWKRGQDPKAADSVQFAELNCETAGALYQDVLTIPGTVLNYSLSHRARGTNNNRTEYDTMFLVIMPTKDSQDLNTQGELENELRRLGINIDEYNWENEENQIVYDQDGILVVRITSDDQDWHNIVTEQYTPQSSMTRFFFMAGSTAAERAGQSNGNTIGNFLDDVWFSQELPPVADDEFSLEIRKEFDGLDTTGIEEVKANIQFVISVKEGDRELSDAEINELFGVGPVIQGENMTSTPEGHIFFSITERKIDTGKTYAVTIEEQKADLNGYQMTSSAKTTVTIGDETPVESDGSSFNLQGKTIAYVTFSNTYERSENKTVSFTKKWDDATNKYGTRPENLQVTLKPTITVDEGGVLTTKELTSADLGGVALTKTISAGSEWKASWDVPVYYEKDGVKVKIDYTVEEGTINSDYVYEATEVREGDGREYTNQFNDEGITQPKTVNQNSSQSDQSKKAAVKEAQKADASSKAADEESALGTPAHNKYIEYNESTGDYTLNLDVTGAQGEASGVDVLFVIDTSGSMAGSWYGGGLLAEVKSLLTKDNGIIDQIFEDEGNVNSVAYVAFSDKSGTETSGWYSDGTAQNLKSAINRLRATGGTNWTYAMQRTSSMLAQRSDNSNEKVVIFLSDGEPTYSIDEDGREYGRGNATRDEYYTEAIAAVNGSQSLQDAQIYSVYLTEGTKDGMQKFARGTGATLKDGTALSTALEEILTTVIPSYKNVVITDILSQYVDFVDENVTVTKRSANGQETVLSGSQYEATIDGKKITVKLVSGDNSLDNGATYTVSFRVKPNETANEEFAKTGYPDEGDVGTGETSAGKEGFHSNDNANVTYTVNDEPGNAIYPDPVVQVTTHSLTFSKEWNQPNTIEKPTENVTLQVTYTDGTKEKIILMAEGNYTFVKTNVPVTRRIASVTETSVFENYTPSYQISADGTSATVINNYSKLTTQTITVQKVWKGNGPESDVEVVLYQSKNNGDAVEFERATLTESSDWKVTWENLPKESSEGGNQETYTYAVREVNTPAGYSSSIRYDFEDKDKTIATITNTYDSNCADENYYIANVLQTEKLTVNKTWEDNDNLSGLRPEELSIVVNDGKDGRYDVKLSEEEGWQETLTILKKKGTTFSAEENLSDPNYQQVGAASIVSSPTGTTISFVNQLQSTSITVQKNWNDGDVQDHPTGIQFALKYRETSSDNWKIYGTYNLLEEDWIYDDDGNEIRNWARKISGLPVQYEYCVEEIDVPDGYNSNVRQSEDTYTYTITNTLKWSLKKTDSPEDSSTTPSGLDGAEFELVDSEEKLIAKGTSETDGQVTWTAEQGVNLDALNGEYKLYETKAPSGYQRLSQAWTLQFSNGLLTDITYADPDANGYAQLTSSAESGVVITIKNEKLYELPEAGGPGTFGYTIGGVLLLMAGTLILYKLKKGEVLKK